MLNKRYLRGSHRQAKRKKAPEKKVSSLDRYVEAAGSAFEEALRVVVASALRVTFKDIAGILTKCLEEGRDPTARIEEYMNPIADRVESFLSDSEEVK